MKLSLLGWDDFRARSGRFEVPPGKILGRIAVEYPTNYLLFTEAGEFEAVIRPKMLKMGVDLPKVGDWVVCEPLPGERKVIVEEILPRFSKISRRETGDRARRTVRRGREQVIATNVDVVFIVQGLDLNYNLNRVERYVAMVREAGAEPVVILNKEDVAVEAGDKLAETASRLPGVSVHLVSAKTGRNLDELTAHIKQGLTIAFLGSSGVGKSTLANRFLGEDRLATNEVREKDARGRHTTTRKEMLLLPGGGILIDTPGMRELQPWMEESALGSAFPELEELSAKCKFRDCAHDEKGRGCAILEAVRRGDIPEARYRNFLKLKKEAAYTASRSDAPSVLERKRRSKKISLAVKRYMKEEDR